MKPQSNKLNKKLYKKGLRSQQLLLTLNKKQREILIGILLGDAHLETQNNGKTYRLKLGQSEKHKEYLFHLYENFTDWVLTPPKFKESNKGWYFNTISHGSFRFYGHQFYGLQSNKKYIPKLIEKWLTPRALAYWYMDDGSIKSKESKGVIFNTHCFELNDIKRLCDIFESKFKLKAWPRKQKHKDKIYYQIYVSGKSYEQLRLLIYPYLISEMWYKFPLPRKEKPKDEKKI